MAPFASESQTTVLRPQSSLPAQDTPPATTSPASVMLDANGNEFRLPDYTIKDIRAAIPARCFERSAIRGFGYIFRDLAMISLIFLVTTTYNTPERVPSYFLRCVFWNVYAFLTGLFATGIWVIAHECGHQAFSPSKTLNDTVGWVLHSSLLVPYFSWKISHGKHHKATGHMERDMVFVPRTRPEYAEKFKVAIENLTEVAEDSPLFSLSYIIARQIFGWPIYLMSNDTGHDCHEKQPEGRGVGKKNGFFTGVNHFNPNSPLFENKDAKLILLSDLGIAITGTVIYLVASKFGWSNVALWYFAPYLWVNHWLVLITYLQHTDPSLPHYDAKSWNFLRGAAATIDRDFGFIGRHILHGIIETHVLHHYISTIPFYHADEATEAIKPVMGIHYRSNTKGGPWGFLTAIWPVFRTCQWVEPSAGTEGESKSVLFYRNRNGRGIPAINMKKRE